MARAEYKVGNEVATTKTAGTVTVIKVYEMRTRCAYKVRCADGSTALVKDVDMLGLALGTIDLSPEGQAELWARLEAMCA